MKSQKRKYCIAIIFSIAIAVSSMILLAQPNDSLRITGAWVRPSVEANDVSAAYLRITNYGEDADRLLAVETTVAAHVELHSAQVDGDIMRMRQVNAIDIPVGETITLQPGGLHIMLMGLREPLVEGESLALTLIFESGATVAVDARITSTPIPYVLAADALTEQSMAAVAAATYVGQVVNAPVQVQDFHAPGSHESITRLSDLDGKWRVIFFGYMHCPDFCPLTLVDYGRVKAALGDAAEDVVFVFVSVDAVRDTPAALQRYLANFDPGFVGFSPDDITLSRIQPDYGFYYERRLDGGSQSVYSIDHSTRSYLLDRDGVLRASFAYQTEPRAIADALLWYIDHE